MAIERRLVAGTLGLALLVAACGGSSATTAPAASTGTGAATPEAVESEAPAASEAAAASEDTEGPDASFTAGGAAELEALLPDSWAAGPSPRPASTVASIAGAGFVDTGELDPILSANGKTIADVRMAIATPTDQGTTQPTVMIALQVRGLDASKLAEFAGASAGGDLTNATIAGKAVQKFGEGAFGGAMYIKDDVLYEILFADDAALEAIVSQLP